MGGKQGMTEWSQFDLWVADIKQYLYCPRVVYFHYVMPVEKKPTYKMELGKEVHEAIGELEKRRKLRAYGLQEGTRVFDVRLNSIRLGLRGRLDMMIRTSDACYPVDFKLTEGRPHKNHLYQLAAYALLIEEEYGCEVKQGFVYLIPEKDAVVMQIGMDLKVDVADLIKTIREMVSREEIPEVNPSRRRCEDCEYQNYCGDVW
jgi:CRISPR-associated exonuclease Cas4